MEPAATRAGLLGHLSQGDKERWWIEGTMKRVREDVLWIYDSGGSRRRNGGAASTPCSPWAGPSEVDAIQVLDCSFVLTPSIGAHSTLRTLLNLYSASSSLATRRGTASTSARRRVPRSMLWRLKARRSGTSQI